MNGIKKSFIQNDDAKFIFDILKAAKNNGSLIIAWKEIGKSKQTAYLKLELIRKYKRELVFLPEQGQLKELEMIISEDRGIRLFLAESAIFFQVEVKKLNDKGQLICHFPNIMAQVERRHSLRLVMDNDLYVQIKFSKNVSTQQHSTQLFDRHCYDLSSEGCSLILTRQESKLFNIGEKINRMNLCLDGKKEYQVEGKIINILSVEPGVDNKLIYKGSRLCIQFIDLNHLIKKALETFVFNHIQVDERVHCH